MKRTFKLLFLPLIFILMSCAVFAEAPESDINEAKAPEISILFTNGIRGDFDHAENRLTLDIIASYFDAKAEEIPATLLLDCGNAVQGDYFTDSNYGVSAIEIMNTAGYDAMCIGTYDFGYSFRGINTLAAIADFPLMTQSSVYTSNDKLTSSVIIERGGYSIGIFSLTTPEAALISGARNRDFGDSAALIELANETTRALREQGADIVICLSQIGDTDNVDNDFGSVDDIAGRVLGIDIVIDGLCVNKIYNSENHTPVAYAGVGTLGLVEFYKADIGFRVEISELTYEDLKDVTPEPKTKRVIEKWHDTVEKTGGKYIGYCDMDFPFDKDTLRHNETELGNLIADVFRESAGTEIAIFNAAMLQGTLMQGDVYTRNINSVIPYSETLYSAQISGATLRAALERSIDISLSSNPRAFLQVSGLNFAYAASNPAGQRVEAVTINGKALDPNKLYTIAAPHEIIKRGSEYDMLSDVFIDAKEVGLTTDLLANYVQQANDGISREIEGRIVELSGKTITSEYVAEQADYSNTPFLIIVALIAVTTVAILITVLFYAKEGSKDGE